MCISDRYYARNYLTNCDDNIHSGLVHV